MSLGFGLAGALSGAGNAMKEDAIAKRNAGLERLKQQMQDDAHMARQKDQQAFLTSERVAGQEFELQNAKPAMPTYTTVYTEDGREQKALVNPRDPLNPVPIGGAKAPSAGVNVNIGGNEFDKGMAKHQAEMFGTLYEGGLKANRDIGLIERLDGLFRQFETGGKASVKQFAGEFGIESEGLDEIQTAQAIINKMVPEQRAPGTGPMSDADLALFKQSLPRIINQPGGNALIIDTLKGIALYQQEQGKIAQQVMTGTMSREDALQALSGLENPLTAFNEALGQTGEDRSMSIRQKYGLE